MPSFSQSMEIRPLRALSDNYVYLLRGTSADHWLVIDPSEASPVERALSAAGPGARLDLILNTHHHGDHVGGNLELKNKWHCEIGCSVVDKVRIPGASRAFHDHERFVFQDLVIEVLAIPGHTKGQVGYLVTSPDDPRVPEGLKHKDKQFLFVGDTVFAMGCGRLLEGTPAQMLKTLGLIAALPPSTVLCVGHEYTEKNAAFALEIEPDNPEIKKRLEQTRAFLNANGGINRPGTLNDELKTNPFFRLNAKTIRKRLGFTDRSSDLEVFTRLRELRNEF